MSGSRCINASAGRPRRAFRPSGVPPRRWGRLTSGVAIGAALALLAVGGGSAGAAPLSPTPRSAVSDVNPSTMPEASTAFRIAFPAWGSTISNNPYGAGYVGVDQFALMGLAEFSNNPRPGKPLYYPELASSWSVGKHRLTLNLRSNARWQNGTPFTSADVLTSLLLAGASGNTVWADISGVATPTSHQVVIDFYSWVVMPDALNSIFGLLIVPKSQYGHLLVPGLKQDLVAYWKLDEFLHPTPSSEAKATASPAGKAMAAVDKALVAYKPAKLIGDGPYLLESASESGILFKKWMGWWDQKVIRVPWVEVLPMSGTGPIFSAILSGDADWEYTQNFTDPQVEKLDHSGKARQILIQSPVQQIGLLFHLRDYPYNLLPVRKALAYMIDRKKVVQLDEAGSMVQNKPSATPDGINYTMADRYLTKKQFASLNHYSYNPSKAAALLKSVGFSKRHGVWYTPKGQVWSVKIYEASTEQQFDEDGIAISSELKDFGIRAETVVVNATGYWSQMEEGGYPISEDWFDWGGTAPNPLEDFAATFGGPPWNYPATYTGKGEYKGGVAIGICPFSKVPGLGRVNIAAALETEVNTAPPSSWARYTWDWARWINQNLPVLSLDDNAFRNLYSTQRYVDFPPRSQEWLWTDLSQVIEPIIWMQQGYLRLRQR